MAIAVASALGLGSCAVGASADDTIRIGIGPWPGYEALYLAQEVGIYERLGVDVRIVEFSSASDATRAFVNGQVDGLATTIVELLALRDRGIDARATLVLDLSEGGDMLMIDPSLGSIAELRGKTVAVEPDSVGVELLDSALRESGISPVEVKVRLVDQLELPELAASGEVQGLVTYVPQSFAIERESGFRPVYSTADMPEPILDVLSFDERLLDERMADVALIIRAWNDALEYAAANVDRAVTVMAEREGVEQRDFLGSLSLMRFVPLDEQHELFTSGRLERICDGTRERLGELDVVTPPTSDTPCTTAMPLTAARKASS